MDNHPIPQNVTGFQFKLIGDMTIKQFAYLALGCVIFYITIFHMPINILIKIPFGAVSLILGVALAFVPIEGRPMDTMFFNFIRDIFTPNQYIFQKAGGQLDIPISSIKPRAVSKTTSTRSAEQLETFLSRIHKGSQNLLDEKEEAFLKSILTPVAQPIPQIIQPQSLPKIQVAVFPIIPTPQKQQKIIQDNIPPQPKVEIKTETPPIAPNIKTNPDESLNKKRKEELDKKAHMIEEELKEAKRQELLQKEAAKIEEAQRKVSELERELRETISQKEQLERQLFALSQKQVFVPSSLDAKIETPNVRKIPKTMGVKLGVPLVPDVPNLITGIVKDSRGNLLPNILVEIKDKDGNPVRAFKTNNLGQFAAATPLLNGVYTIIFEDPEEKHKFDMIEIAAVGEIIPPIEVISTDAREELRKELFGER